MTTPYEYRTIPLDLVDVPKRTIRARRPEEIEALAKDIAANGLLVPIIVVELEDGRFAVDDGVKRILAQRLNKADEIDARVTRLSWLTPEGRTIRGLMANLNRGTYTALEQYEALFTLKEAYEKEHPEAKNGGDRKSQAAKNKAKNQNEIFAFRSEAAEAIGLSVRSIEFAVSIWKKLTLVTKERLRSTPFERRQCDLKALSDEDGTIQNAALDLLLADPPGAASVAEAIALAKGEKPDDVTDKVLKSVTDKLGRDRALRRAVFTLYRDEFRKFAEEDGWFA